MRLGEDPRAPPDARERCRGKRRRFLQWLLGDCRVLGVGRRIAGALPQPDLEELVHVLELDPLGAVELSGEVLDELPAHRMGNGDAARRRRLLQADGEAHRGAEAVVALDEDVGERHAEAGVHGPRALGIARRHPGLELDRPFDRVLDARELDEGAVAHGLEEVAAMGGDRRPEQSPPNAGEIGQRAALILVDEVGYNPATSSEASTVKRRGARRISVTPRSVVLTQG